jgi:hypothetical protein
MEVKQRQTGSQHAMLKENKATERVPKQVPD